MKKLYEKKPLSFALIWIGVYCFMMSLGDALSADIGIDKIISLPIALILSLVLFVFAWKNSLMSELGLCLAKVPKRTMLYYVPLLILLTVNLWCGITVNASIPESVLYVLTMLCVGFLEEVIFRGLLFGAMKKDGLRLAVIVSSLSFGIGHIINLFNGSGAELLPNLLQVVYATAVGFMFVMIYLKTKSLIVCILTHGIFNSLSIISKEAPTVSAEVLICILMSVISLSYALYIAHTLKKKPSYK